MAQKVTVKVKSKQYAQESGAKSGKAHKRHRLVSPFGIYWTKLNYFIFGLGLALTILGFYLMSIKPWNSTASLTVSPIVLCIAYFIVFPLAIFIRKKAPESSTP
jgi:ATP/ADP translocase